MSSVITNNTNHKIIMLLCKRKLYLVCRLAGYAVTLSCLPRLGIYLTILHASKYILNIPNA